MLFLEIKVSFDSKKEARDFFKSIEPELMVDFARSTTKVSLKESTLTVELAASDKKALRASLNAITKPLALYKELSALS